MTKHCFIANIGQRDLQVNYDAVKEADPKLGEKLYDAGQKKNMRVLGGLILKHFEMVEPFLGAPILGTALRELALNDEMPDEVVLVGTKQTDKKFFAGDTFRSAEVLVRLLETRFQGASRFRSIEVSGTPNDLNTMLEEYGKVCSGITAERVHALCTGGTPACNMALSLRAIEFFGEGCTVFHVAENAAVPTRLHIGRYIFAQHRKIALERLARRGDFDAIAEDGGYAKPVRSLARAAAARLNFNFKESLDILQQLNGSCIEAPLDKLREAGQILAAGNHREASLEEVYWNALLKWRRDECTDYLGRVWRLLEGSLQNVIRPVIGCKITDKKIKRCFEDWIEGQDECRKYVCEKANYNKTSRLTPTMPVLTITLSYLIKNDPELLSKTGLDRARAEKLYDAVKALRPLTDLRNASVMAHGFAGVWKEKILAQVSSADGEQGLHDKLRCLLESQNIVPGEDPVACFADALIKLNGEMDYDSD
ncbi:MAG: hypothetical protein KAH38_01770 [Candidatus Hydrogenedentes bacterium]|nr:hypothetical protein [Candidatus Hydrogenedentota bacterium]